MVVITSRFSSFNNLVKSFAAFGSESYVCLTSPSWNPLRYPRRSLSWGPWTVFYIYMLDNDIYERVIPIPHHPHSTNLRIHQQWDLCRNRVPEHWKKRYWYANGDWSQENRAPYLNVVEKLGEKNKVLMGGSVKICVKVLGGKQVCADQEKKRVRSSEAPISERQTFHYPYSTRKFTRSLILTKKRRR